MNPLCKPWEHAASRRQFLGASAGALALGALGGMISPQAAEALRKAGKPVGAPEQFQQGKTVVKQ